MIRFLALLTILFCLSSPAQAEILNIKEVKSAGGITAWLVEDHTIPVLSLRFSFRESGSSSDPADKQGLSRMLSNTMDEGAGDLDSKAFQGLLNDLSISLSFSASRDDFGGSLKTLTKNRTKAFELLSLALTKPRFDAEAVERMRQANLSRIRTDMNDPDWMVARLLNATLFKGHPYELNSGGTLTSLKKINGDDLRQKLKSALTRDHLVVAVAGDISEAELAIALDEIFGSLPAQSEKSPIADVQLPEKGGIVLYPKEIPQTVIQMALPGIKWKDPDYSAAEVMNFVFGGAGFGSRLMTIIREQRGLTYGIYSGLSEMDHAEIFSISSSTRNETVKELIDLTRAEMDTFLKGPVTAQELHNAKTYLIGSVPLNLTSTDEISAYMLAFQMEGLPRNYLDLREKSLRAVTADDVARVSKRLLDPQKMTIMMVGKPSNLTPTSTVTSLPNVE